MKSAVALCIVFIATTAPVASRTSPALAASVTAISAQRTGPDACGYRHAIWGVAQQTANYISQVADGSISDTYTAGMEDTYVIEQEVGMASDYNYSQGRTVENIVADLTGGNLDNAVQAGSYSSNFGYFLHGARADQARLWTTIKAICPSNGQGFTWTGYLNRYGLKSATVIIHVPHAWELDWDFDCGDQSGNFIATVKGSGYFYKQAANDLKKMGYGFTAVNRGGSFTVSVISECAWHIKATNQ